MTSHECHKALQELEEQADPILYARQWQQIAAIASKKCIKEGAPLVRLPRYQDPDINDVFYDTVHGRYLARVKDEAAWFDGMLIESAKSQGAQWRISTLQGITLESHVQFKRIAF